VLNWVSRFSIFCFLDNNNYPTASPFQCLAGAGEIMHITDDGESFAQLGSFIKEHQDWIFGHFSYDLKNQIEDLYSSKPNHIHFPDIFFFIPQTLITLTKTELTIGTINGNNGDIYSSVINTALNHTIGTTPIDLRTRFSKGEYITTIKELQAHIKRGNCYEINFCQEFYNENAECDPVHIFKNLSDVSSNPFSCLYRVNNSWLICASPERYLQKIGKRILSQPIKGTASRKPGSEDDDQLKEKLKTSTKDRAENVMIVDLVRNDLSKICTEGSVTVEELFGLYSFPQVHQMISTVAGILKDPEDFENIFKATFPIGSMTGAPKKRVLQLIEEYERSGRGIFSGAVGYFSPGGNFDFNVVIRSIMYNAENKYLSIQVGSAITANSIAEEEYDECLVKIDGLLKALKQ
jgi:para-aminobenzoate synthetase component 1